MTHDEATEVLRIAVQRILKGGIWVTGTVEIKTVPKGYDLIQEDHGGRVSFRLEPKKAHIAPLQGLRSQNPSELQTLTHVSGDAPPCPKCGAITRRTGTCYTCVNCGEPGSCG